MSVTHERIRSGRVAARRMHVTAAPVVADEVDRAVPADSSSAISHAR